jgi:hypothetical protein
MAHNSAGPLPAATVVKARDVDQLSSKIDSENTKSDAAVKFHPLADMFPLMEGEEFDQLVADIETNGLNEDIITYNGMILDGRNRYRACLAAGWHPVTIAEHFVVGGSTLGADRWIDDPVAYVISANIHRRNLTPELKAEVLAKLVAMQPEKSDRELAKQARVSHPTIAKARRKAEATGKALPVEKRVGADGKARKRPAKKAHKQPAEKKTAQQTAIELFDAVGKLAKREMELGFVTAEQIEAAVLPEHGATVVEKLRAAEIKIVGLENEVEELKAENAKLREQLEAAQKVVAS